MVAFPLVALAELLVAFIGFGVWAHHMFATGLPTDAVVFFAAASDDGRHPERRSRCSPGLLTVTMGRPQFKAPLLFIGGFIVFFVLGGLSGIMFAAIPFDQATTDTYFVVAHFHFIIFGAAVFPLLGGLFYWFPKVTGRLYHERLAQAGFWLTFVGTALTFFPMHIVGLLGMTRRIYTYPSADSAGTTYNLIETIGAFVLAAGLVLIAVNLVWSRCRGAPAGRDPFCGGTLEWTTDLAAAALQLRRHPDACRARTRTGTLEDREEDVRDLDARRARRSTTGTRRRRRRCATRDLDEVLEMPSESAWPIVVALCVTVALRARAASHYLAAAALRRRSRRSRVGAGTGRSRSRSRCDRSRRPGARPRAASSNGWWGMVAFVATEATLFGALLGTYVYLRCEPCTGRRRDPEPKVVLPLVLAGVARGDERPDVPRARAPPRPGSRGARRRSSLVALVVQARYFGIAGPRARRATSTGSRRSRARTRSIYYTLLGADHAHVAVGILHERVARASARDAA